MKTPLNLHLLCGFAAVLLLSNIAAHAYYDPTVGRWANRDPVEEHGGANLYALVANKPLVDVDPFGLSSFTATDLGLRPPIPNPRTGGGIFGSVRLNSWTLFARLDQCADRCNSKVTVTHRWAAVEYWWSTPEDRIHELNHVFIWENTWGDLTSSVNSFTDTCFSQRKAQCYQFLVPSYRDAYLLEAQASNWEFDCASYGQYDPAACTRAQQLRAQVTALMQQVLNAERQCSAIP